MSIRWHTMPNLLVTLAVPGDPGLGPLSRAAPGPPCWLASSLRSCVREPSLHDRAVTLKELGEKAALNV